MNNLLVFPMDDTRIGEVFFGIPVVSLTEGVLMERAVLVITSLKRRDELTQLLKDLGVASCRVLVAGDVGGRVTPE